MASLLNALLVTGLNHSGSSAAFMLLPQQAATQDSHNFVQSQMLVLNVRIPAAL
jgi:hypothetical protein